MCYYTTKNQYEAIKAAKNMIAENLYSFTANDIEYAGKSGVWFNVAPRNKSIVEKIALLSVLASGSLTNGYWRMPSTEDCCRKYKKIRKAWNAGKRPEFYDEYDEDWDESYEVVAI